MGFDDDADLEMLAREQQFAEHAKEMERIAVSYPHDGTWQVAVDFVTRHGVMEVAI